MRFLHEDRDLHLLTLGNRRGEWRRRCVRRQMNQQHHVVRIQTWKVDRSLPGLRVARVLDRLAETIGLPETLVMDNGPEFSGRPLDTWAYARGVQLRFIRPGKPTENACVESFNCKFRDECLNEHWFASVAEAHQLIEAWRVDYNTVRPHSALRKATPDEFANSLCGHSPAQTPARADWKSTKNEDPKPEDLSLSV